MTDEHVHGYSAEKSSHLKRLRRIEGQVRGLQRMIDEETYCIDILTQVSAATKALENVALSLLDEHLRHCVTDAALAGGPMAAEASVILSSASVPPTRTASLTQCRRCSSSSESATVSRARVTADTWVKMSMQ